MGWCGFVIDGELIPVMIEVSLLFLSSSCSKMERVSSMLLLTSDDLGWDCVPPSMSESIYLVRGLQRLTFYDGHLVIRVDSDGQ